MIVFLCILFAVLAIVFFCMSFDWDNGEGWQLVLSAICGIISVVILIFGMFNGFVYYPKTEGTHVGIITAVDLEGKYFRRYEIFLKSGGHSSDYTESEQSDETKYLIYETEEGLAKQLKECIGKKVKLHYGHDGGYIGWKSCGTYHIKSVELLGE